MEGRRRIRPQALAALVAVALALFVMLQAAVAMPALADEADAADASAALTITGMDSYYGAEVNASADKMDLLAVSSDHDARVWARLVRVRGDVEETLIDREPVDIEPSGLENYVGTVTASFNTADFESDATYRISVFADREETEALYEGTVTSVMAVDEAGEPIRLLGVRTLAEGESREFRAPQYIAEGGQGYELVGEAGEGAYAYAAADTPAEVDGSIAYVDAEGNVLRVDPIPAVGAEPRFVPVQALIQAQGATWRTICLNGGVTAQHPGASDFTVVCARVEGDLANQAGFYLATINLVGDGGEVLATDTASVVGTYEYTPPKRLHLQGEDGTWVTWELVPGAPLDSAGVLELSAKPNATEEDATVEVRYTSKNSGNEATLTVIRVNGADGTEIDRRTLTATRDEPATYAVEQSVTVGGRELVPVAQTPAEVTYAYGSTDRPVQRVYYVPADYVAPGPYDVRVRYADVEANTVIEEKAVSVSADQGSVTIDYPSTLTKGGKRYVLLSGQKSPITHSYWSAARTYTVWYRAESDKSNASVTATATQVENTTAASSTATSSSASSASQTATTSAQSASKGDAAQPAPAIPEDDGLTLVSGKTLRTITDGKGRDMNTARTEAAIQESEVEEAETAQAAASTQNYALIGVGVAAIAAAGIFFYFRNRRQTA